MRSFHAFRICYCLLIFGAPSFADQAEWQRFVDKQTFLVATAPVAADAWAGWLDEAGKLNKPAATEVRGMLEQLQGFGARRVMLFAGVPELHVEASPVVAVSFPAAVDRSEVNRQAMQSLGKLRAMNSSFTKITTQWVAGDTGDAWLLLGTERTVSRYAQLHGQPARTPRADLTTALGPEANDSEGVSGEAFVILAPGADARRVIRELLPPQPAPWGELTGTLLADGLHYARLSLRLQATPKVRLDLVAAEETTAEKVNEIVQLILDLDGKKMAGSDPRWSAVVQTLSQSLKLNRQQRCVSIGLARDQPAVEKLLSELLPSTALRISEQAFRVHRTNQLKQLGLAMHNYHSVHKHFPSSAAIRDKDGKPLLSWRVAILPFIESNTPYKKFRLDEPWDSPHNLPLLKEMPKAFADPGNGRLARQGMTTYQVPVGAGTLFAPADQSTTLLRKGLYFGEGFSYKQVTDGTSQTMMIAEVAAKHAVPWTKPADWEVDFANPLAAIRQEGRDVAVASWADGSVRAFQLDMDEKEFAKVLTKGGGELSNRDKW